MRILEVCELRGGARCVPGVCLPGNRRALSLVPPRLLRAQKRSRAVTCASAADRAVHAHEPEGKWQEAERAECSKTSGNSERSKAGRRRVLAPAGRRMELSASLQVCAANMACWGAVLAEGSSVSALGGHRRRFLSAPLPGACVQVSELCATCSAGRIPIFVLQWCPPCHASWRIKCICVLHDACDHTSTLHRSFAASAPETIQRGGLSGL